MSRENRMRKGTRYEVSVKGKPAGTIPGRVYLRATATTRELRTMLRAATDCACRNGCREPGDVVLLVEEHRASEGRVERLRAEATLGAGDAETGLTFRFGGREQFVSKERAADFAHALIQFERASAHAWSKPEGDQPAANGPMELTEETATHSWEQGKRGAGRFANNASTTVSAKAAEDTKSIAAIEHLVRLANTGRKVSMQITDGRGNGYAIETQPRQDGEGAEIRLTKVGEDPGFEEVGRVLNETLKQSATSITFETEGE